MRQLTIAASIAGLAAVAFGAFGAHGLEDRLSDQALEWWGTATSYALPHAVAAVAIGLSGRAGFATAGWAFLIGAKHARRAQRHRIERAGEQHGANQK
ncbi:MAG: DUF423 domain-containing protein, partial [Pseudomonadota bacterium]